MTTLTTAGSATSTQAVVDHHLQQFYALNLQGVLADYDGDAVMIVPSGVLRGVAGIRPLFEALIAEFAKPGASFDLQQQVIEGDVAYIRWVAATADNVYEPGTDTRWQNRGTDLCIQENAKGLIHIHAVAEFNIQPEGCWTRCVRAKQSPQPVIRPCRSSAAVPVGGIAKRPSATHLSAELPSVPPRPIFRISSGRSQ